MATQGRHRRLTEGFAALVLHDSPAVVELVTRTLNHGLFEVRDVRTLGQAEALLAAWLVDLAVVDLDHEDTVDLLKLLGASNTMTTTLTPVLALARRCDLAARLRAFNLGVDDVVAMPFAPEELLARAKVLARRAAGIGHQVVPTIRLADREIDLRHGEVRRPGGAAPLTRTEQALLRVLAANAGRVVTRDEMLDAVWGMDHLPASNVVDRHIRDVRLKLGDDARRPVFIETVAGQGYRFLPVYGNGSWESGRSNSAVTHGR